MGVLMVGVTQLSRELEKKITPKNKRPKEQGRPKRRDTREMVTNSGTDDELAAFIEQSREHPVGEDLAELLSWNPIGAIRVYEPHSTKFSTLEEEFLAATRVASDPGFTEALKRGAEVLNECRRNGYYLVIVPD